MPRSRRARASRRTGFTLLEILLAILIASMLLAALYLMMSVTLRQTQASRDASEVEDLSRGIFNKMTVDLSGTLTPLPPRSGGNPLTASSGTTSSTAAPSTTTPSTTTPSSTGAATGSGGSTAPATGTGTAAAPSTTTTPSTTTPTDTETDNPNAGAADSSIQGGVIGSEKKLVVFAGRVPEAFGRFGNPGEQVRADQRKITYWLGPGGGLYRQERPWVTSDEVRTENENENENDPDPEAPDAVLVAEEVSDVSFEYTDGSTWTTEWKGTDLGPDGVTPLGPPRAIRVTLVLKIPTGKSGETVEKRLTQVMPVRSAPGTNTPTFIEPPIDGATDTTTSGATGSSATSPTTGGTQPSTGGATGGTSSPSGGATTSPSTGGTRPSTGTGMTTGGATGGAAGGGSSTTGGRSGGGK